MKNRVLAAIGGFGFAFGAFAGVGTMEGGHFLLGLALVGLAVVSGVVLVWVTSRQADRVRAEIEARDV